MTDILSRPAAPELREVLYAAATSIGRLELRTLALPEDADTIYGWTRGAYARFWEMCDHDRDTVQDIQAYLDASSQHSAQLWWLGGRPVGLLQTYAPAAEAVGACYAVRPSDLGMHFFVAPVTDRPRSLTGLMAEHSLRFMLADPGVYRVVAEPDIANLRAVARFKKMGFVCGPVVELPEKTAQLAFLTRDRWADLYGE